MIAAHHVITLCWSRADLGCDVRSCVTSVCGCLALLSSTSSAELCGLYRTLCRSYATKWEVLHTQTALGKVSLSPANQNMRILWPLGQTAVATRLHFGTPTRPAQLGSRRSRLFRRHTRHCSLCVRGLSFAVAIESAHAPILTTQALPHSSPDMHISSSYHAQIKSLLSRAVNRRHGARPHTCLFSTREQRLRCLAATAQRLHTLTVPAQNLTPEAFAPFGQVQPLEIHLSIALSYYRTQHTRS